MYLFFCHVEFEHGTHASFSHSVICSGVDKRSNLPSSGLEIEAHFYEINFKSLIGKFGGNIFQFGKKKSLLVIIWSEKPLKRGQPHFLKT